MPSAATPQVFLRRISQEILILKGNKTFLPDGLLAHLLEVINKDISIEKSLIDTRRNQEEIFMNNSLAVTTVIANFVITGGRRWSKLIGRLPIILLLCALCLTGFTMTSMLDVDKIGPRIFLDWILISIALGVVSSYALAQYFILTNAIAKSDLNKHEVIISWWRIELLEMATVIVILVLKFGINNSWI